MIRIAYLNVATGYVGNEMAELDIDNEGHIWGAMVNGKWIPQRFIYRIEMA